MAIRITGLNSGLDTESIISELVSAKKTSVNSLKKAQIKLSWKIDAWQTLNSKIYKLYTGTVDNLRFDSAYTKKKTTVSDSNILSVVSGDNSANGVQTASVESLAKAGYLTGGKLETADGGKVTANTKLTDLGLTAGTSFTITSGGTSTEISIGEDTTISNLVSQLKTAGVNANFDENNQRLFVSAKSTGAENDFSFDGDEATLKTLGLMEDPDNEYGAVKVDGSNAVLYLNGAKFESNTNTFQINESTYTVTGVSDKNADGSLKETSITIADDYDGIYDTIKNFLTQYNSLINEMDTLYNADSASDYEPLLSDEKDALTDTEISEWDTKIKDSLLRKDSSLSAVITAMTSAMSGSVTVNGKEMYLSSFGINTLGYFNAEENERHAYHIDGDPDDSNTSGNTDTLKSMIASDPDTVKSFFTQLASNLYDNMTSTMNRVEGYKSKYKVYNDKKLDSDLSDYEDKIADAEDALTAYEDKWYDKFSTMETALAKLSSKESAISSLFSS
jgi:flagellar hook-associated protein 2